MANYEFISKIIKKDSSPLYVIQSPESKEESLKSYKEIQTMLMQGGRIDHLILGVDGTVLEDISYETEIKNLFQFMMTDGLTDSPFAGYMSGNVSQVKFGLEYSYFRLSTNVTYNGSPLDLQFELSATREINGAFDKPPLKIKVKYLSKGRALKELCTCIVFNKLNRHTFGMSDYIPIYFSTLVLNVCKVLFRLEKMSHNLLSGNIFQQRAFYSDKRLYAAEIAELLSARIIDRYNIFSLSCYPLEVLDNNMNPNKRNGIFFADSEFIKGVYHLDRAKYGRTVVGIGLTLLIKVAALNAGWNTDNVCSIVPRLWVTEHGIILQFIKLYSSADIDTNLLSSKIYTRSLIEKEFILPLQELSRSSVCKLVDEFIGYIDIFKSKGDSKNE